MCIADDLAYVSCVFILILSLCFSSEAVYIYIYICIYLHLSFTIFIRTDLGLNTLVLAFKTSFCEKY